VREFRFRHVGDATPGKAFRKLEVELVKYANESVSDDEAKISAARKYVLGNTQEEVVETAKKLVDLSFKRLNRAYEIATEHENTDGNANTAYGLANGITRLSQEVTAYADERNTIDREAGKLLKIAF
jgi:hypothetical protein